ncbi:MAG: DUF29 domain-containing protein [Desulfobacterales bacterium]|nr:DUF29 domain-containing protein [Desulfobacterales bacterium]
MSATELSKLYEEDVYTWAMCNAELLRRGCFDQIDVEHIAEEIESVGKSERRELENRLILLLAHLLKWQYQPERRGAELADDYQRAAASGDQRAAKQSRSQAFAG